ncbi:hypothetical protein ACIGO9_31725 [Nocardia asteroides]|uniref:hypothetical protein n=1 Tax=Nocardia asteroides TaxID=1824 RepID=UPI0037CB6B77
MIDLAPELAPWTNPLPNLPDPIRLEHGCRGLPLVNTGIPVLDSTVEVAAELAELHRDRSMGFDLARVDRHRKLCASVLDTLAAVVLPAPAPAAPIHTEPFGALIDRLASWSVLLGDRSPVQLNRQELGIATEQVSELCRVYAELLDDAAAGAIRIPRTTILTPAVLTGMDLLHRRFD